MSCAKDEGCVDCHSVAMGVFSGGVSWLAILVNWESGNLVILYTMMRLIDGMHASLEGQLASLPCFYQSSLSVT